MNKIPKLLILAVVVAFILRFWHLNTIPTRPDGDEVAFGYYGWSLLHYGTDEFGKFLPASFTSIGDNKYPVLGYLNTIPALIFGLSNATTRLWSAVSGVALVILIFLLSENLFSNRKVSIFSAWAMALSPWAIVLSRIGYETLLSTALTAAGIISLLYFIKSKKTKPKKVLLISSSVFLLISFFTYAASRFFIPAFLLGLFGLSFIKGSSLKSIRKFIIIFFIVIAGFILISLKSSSNWGRAGQDAWKGISSSENNRLQELYIEAGTSFIKLPARVTWLFHNKYRIALFDFIDRYTAHFSVSYLFTNGEGIGQKIPDMGVLLLINLLLLPFGIAALVKSDSKESVKIIFLWLLLAPIPSALTVTDSKMIRASLLLVPFSLLSGLGFGYLAGLLKGKEKLISTLIILGFAASSLYALNQIFVQKPLDQPWTKQEVNEKLTDSILNLKDKYRAVATGGDDYIFFLFYGKISPSEFLKNADIQKQSPWQPVTRLYNIYFNMPFKCPKGGKLNVLYVCEGVEVPQNSKIIQSFYYPDGVAAYTLIEFYPESQMPNKLPELPEKFHYMVDTEHIYPDGIIPSGSTSLW